MNYCRTNTACCRRQLLKDFGQPQCMQKLHTPCSYRDVCNLFDQFPDPSFWLLLSSFPGTRLGYTYHTQPSHNHSSIHTQQRPSQLETCCHFNYGRCKQSRCRYWHAYHEFQGPHAWLEDCPRNQARTQGWSRSPQLTAIASQSLQLPWSARPTLLTSEPI